ncbi:MAG: N-acetyl-gamma-glutamyl-phosphate reductase [Bacteroidota bacterium]
MPTRAKIGIVGAAGYTAGELMRLLVHHPSAEIVWAQSQSQAGKTIADIHQDLIGELNLHFVANPPELSVQASAAESVDVIFLCAGHGRSRGWMEQHQPPAEALVVDLSSDHRLDPSWVYGLPELNREAIRGHRRVANPGCFATAIQLGLLPLAAAGHPLEQVHIHAITGSTGAGQLPRTTTHFSWRDNNISIYKAFRHQHEAEIKRSLQQAAGHDQQQLHFLPVRGNFSRGIFANLYTSTDLGASALSDLYQAYYQDHPFVFAAPTQAHLKQVVNTNKALYQVERIDDRVLVTSMIDNLLKGASGQAVQNMNLALGLSETEGLRLKPSAF